MSKNNGKSAKHEAKKEEYWFPTDELHAHEVFPEEFLPEELPFSLARMNQDPKSQTADDKKSLCIKHDVAFAVREPDPGEEHHAAATSTNSSNRVKYLPRGRRPEPPEDGIVSPIRPNRGK